jgi:Spy/CpxP family protein refolding chaperone
LKSQAPSVFTFIYTHLTHVDMDLLSYIPQEKFNSAHRSKQMNKLMISVMTVLLLAVSGMAVAQDGGQGPGNKGQRPHRGMQAQPRTMMEGVMRAIKRLDLSEEQKEGIWSTAHSLKGELHPVMVEMRNGQRELRELISSGSFDEKAVAALAEKEGDLTKQRILLTSAAVADVLGQLTEDQRAQLEAMAAERQQRAKGKKRPRGKRGGQGNPPPAEG